MIGLGYVGLLVAIASHGRVGSVAERRAWRISNIGNNQPVELLHVVAELEKCLGKKARRELLPMQPGDVPETYADVDDLIRDVGFRPSTPVETGIRNFVDWYRAYTGV